MMRYSVQLRDWIFVKRPRFFVFCKKCGQKNWWKYKGWYTYDFHFERGWKRGAGGVKQKRDVMGCTGRGGGG